MFTALTFQSLRTFASSPTILPLDALAGHAAALVATSTLVTVAALDAGWAAAMLYRGNINTSTQAHQSNHSEQCHCDLHVFLLVNKTPYIRSIFLKCQAFFRRQVLYYHRGEIN